jgi:putative membrane protein
VSVGDTGYRLLLALHIVATVAWMAGIFYLPRIFVYHAGAEAGSTQAVTFMLMERRCYGRS